MANKSIPINPGTVFGRLTVIKELPYRHPTGRNILYRCQCDCGAIVDIVGSDLRTGNTKSCGCFRREAAMKYMTRHGATETPEHNTWMRMNERCNNPNGRKWKDYGGRGISICNRWQGEKGFANFLADMGPRPTKKHTLDRIDNDGDYEPNNCRWATYREQANNKRNNRRITVNGITCTIAEWARRSGINEITIWYRLHRGWDVARAISEPIRAAQPETFIDIKSK